MHLQEEGVVRNEEVQNRSFADYGPTVLDMNKTHNSNLIENIVLDFLVPNFLWVGAPLASNHIFVFYGQMVGDINKTHNFNMIENIFVQF